jgi:hypothetical protein
LIQILQQAWGQTESLAVADREVHERGSRYIDFLIPGLIAVNLMSGSMWGIAWVIVEMRVRKLLKRLLAAPMRRRDLMFSFGLARLVIVPVELVLILYNRGRMKITPRACAKLLTICGFATFAGRQPAGADVLPPPPEKPLQCGLGQDESVDHSGYHCAYRSCRTDFVCPAGMACVARSETHCDPRGQPCSTNMVGRCAKVDSKPKPLRCPTGAEPDAGRTATVLAKLGTDEDGKRTVASLARELTICYGEVSEGVVQTDGVLVLQRSRSPAANAARLGHQLLHLVQGPPLDEEAARKRERPCKDLIEWANTMEKSAHNFESQLRKKFGLAPLPYEDRSDEYAKRCQALRGR